MVPGVLRVVGLRMGPPRMRRTVRRRVLRAAEPRTGRRRVLRMVRRPMVRMVRRRAVPMVRRRVVRVERARAVGLAERMLVPAVLAVERGVRLLREPSPVIRRPRAVMKYTLLTAV
jgi:hypothetical protein